MKKPKHHRAFRIKFIGATDYKGERVGILDLRHNNNSIISYDYSKNNIKEIAIDWLEKQGIEISGFVCNEITNEYYLLTDSFQSLKGEY